MIANKRGNLAEPASEEWQEDRGHQPHDPDGQPTECSFDSPHLDVGSGTDTVRRSSHSQALRDWALDLHHLHYRRTDDTA